MTRRLVRRDPFHHWFAWPRWMDEWEESNVQGGLKIHETDKNIVAEAVVAGVPTDNVEVHIEDGVLTIKAEASQENLPASKAGRKKGEYQFSSYQYYYTAALSGGQWGKAKADVEDGVVKVVIPKAEVAKPRKIKVTAKSKK
ncbi:Hsp20/alpha crystallin family protein [Patescibacteria group bacterium]|nr:Hsp20/alpha crystallin family protein [Patescibacteria group bacterium]